MYEYLNFAWYAWKRNNWMVYPPRFFSSYPSVKIKKPIFFLGNHGDGTTLTMRIMKRNKRTVSVTGNKNYWTGADEMQGVMEFRLPHKLRLSTALLSTDPPHPKFSQPRSWSYASDELIGLYHTKEEAYSEEDERILKKTIRECIHRFALDKNDARFVDKSSVYTVKLRYLNSLVKDVDPYYVLISRNPYATCYRSATGSIKEMRRYFETMTLEERLQICAEHWKNAMRIVMEDKDHVKRFKHIRMEDVLMENEATIRDLCSYLDMEFDPDMLPAAHHKISFGTRYTQRWYPLKPEVNNRYLEALTPELFTIVHKEVGEVAKMLGYEPPERFKELAMELDGQQVEKQ